MASGSSCHVNNFHVFSAFFSLGHSSRKKKQLLECIWSWLSPTCSRQWLPLFGLEGRPAKHRGLVAPATFPHPLPKAHASWPRQTFRQTSWQLWLPFPQVTSLIVYDCFVQVVILVLMGAQVKSVVFRL